ncbi:MAG: hypothetical protein AAB320_03875 [Elusimicrobiota bacterium]
MDFETFFKRLKLAGFFLAILMSGFIFLQSRSAQERMRRALEGSEDGAPKPGEPFYTELLGGLESTAKQFEGQSTNKRVFVLTLLAEACPLTEAGRNAQKGAVAKGLEVAGKTGEKGSAVWAWLEAARRPASLLIAPAVLDVVGRKPRR